MNLSLRWRICGAEPSGHWDQGHDSTLTAVVTRTNADLFPAGPRSGNDLRRTIRRILARPSPRVGSLRAKIWYARQVISFLSIRSFGGLPEKAGLTCTSLISAGIGCWLMAMEQVLRHSGYAERTAIATCIMLQGISTLLVLMFGVGSICPALVLLSAVSLALFGAFSMERILQSEHLRVLSSLSAS